MARLGKRIGIVTGLATDTDADDAELLQVGAGILHSNNKDISQQVANYMNGGHYNPHHDYVMKEKNPAHVRFS